MSESTLSNPKTDNLEPLIGEILALFASVTTKLEPDNQEMKTWMADHFQNPAIIELLQETTYMMLRVLDAVGQLEPVNGITIARQFHIPRGTVSKTARRLLAKKLITRETLPDNRKEFLFRLTPLGKALFDAHRAFDRQMESGFIRFLSRYNSAELGFIVRMLQDVTESSFLNSVTDDQSGDSLSLISSTRQ